MVVMFCILIGVVVTQVYTFVKSPNLYLRYVCFIEDAWYWFIGKEMRVRREETKGGKKKKKNPLTFVNLNTAETGVLISTGQCFYPLGNRGSILLQLLLQISPGHLGYFLFMHQQVI